MPHLDVEAVKTAIQEVADEHILPFFRQLKAEHISFKIGDDPVTIADKNTESALSTRLLDLLPGSKVVGEEAFSSNRGISESFLGESPVWVIDPIDGTRNFVRGSPEFGVIVALSEQNQIVAGFIYDPTSREFVTVEQGGGAWYKDERLKILPSRPLPEMLGCLANEMVSDYGQPKPGDPRFEIMGAGAHEYPRMVIERPHFGKHKPQFHFRASKIISNPWDDAAGVLMHREAGGYAANWRGEPYSTTIMDRGLLIAPDRDSWEEIKRWSMTFCDLPLG